MCKSTQEQILVNVNIILRYCLGFLLTPSQDEDSSQRWVCFFSHFPKGDMFARWKGCRLSTFLSFTILFINVRNPRMSLWMCNSIYDANIYLVHIPLSVQATGLNWLSRGCLDCPCSQASKEKHFSLQSGISPCKCSLIYISSREICFYLL